MKYHIIQIDDSRQDNVNDIVSKINGERLDIKSVNGHDTTNLNSFYENNQDFKITGKSLSRGEVGCFASHFLAWKYVVSNNINELLILEDDAKIENDFIKKFNFTKKYLPDSYEIFFTFVDDQMKLRYDYHKHYLGNIFLTKAFQDWSTLGYMVSLNGAKRGIELIRRHGMRSPIDNFILQTGMVAFSPHPENILPISINKKYKSMIQGEQNV